ncbi:MAG: M14 family zinc carboxypeptidase [Verrucomicrobiia bacterium]
MKKVTPERTMKFKIILCLALVLSGILLCCSSIALGADMQLQVRFDFPGGSAKVLKLDPASNMVRITPAGDPKRGWPCWWYFRLDNVDTGKPVVLEVTANQGVVRNGDGDNTRKLPAAYSLPEYAAFSTDGTNWEHTARGERQGDRSIYRIDASTSTLWLAWGPPFTLKDADQLIQKTCDLCPYAKSFVLARTRGDRPVPGVRISQPGAANGPRFTVWIQARQHAWESGSSWVARGFVEWLVSNDPSAESLRGKADIVIIPVVDVDSVETGQGGKEQVPHDQDRDWGTAPYFPEVAAGMSRLTALAKADRLDLFLDLHNPGYSARDIDFYIASVPFRGRERVANEDNFLKIVQEQMTGSIKFNGRIGPVGKTYDPTVNKAVDAWVAAQSRPHVVSLTMEIPWNISASTASGYLKVGEQLGRSIDLYLQPAIRSGSQ